MSPRVLNPIIIVSAIAAVVAVAPRSVPAKGPNLAGLEASPQRYADVCRTLFAEVGETARRGYDKEGRIRARMARFTAITDSDNARFVALAERANDGLDTPAKLFAFSENAVLKELNDKVIEDKDLVTALTNLHKDLQWSFIESDSELKGHLIAQYSDFKVLQFALDTKEPAIMRRLDARVAEVERRYDAYLEDLAVRKGWKARGRGISSSPETWFHSGHGSSGDQAAASARDSRYHVGRGGKPGSRSFAEATPNLAEAARSAGTLRQWAQERFGATKGFLFDAGEGKRVLSAEAIEMLKKLKVKDDSATGYAAALGEAARMLFGLELTEREALQLRDYVEAADRFSPPLLLSERVVIDLGEATHGVASGDFTGQNSRNLQETLAALARMEGKPLPEVIREVRRGERRATQALNDLKARFRRVVARVLPGHDAQFSGDDGIVFLAQPLTDPQRRAIARDWIADGGRPRDLRLTFEEFRYADTGAVVPVEQRSRLIQSAEAIEKGLRAGLAGTLTREELAALHIAVSLEARERGEPTASILLTSGGKPAAGVVDRVREALVRDGVRPGRIELN